MPFANIGNIELYYERHGAGPPLLFIGGTGGDLRRPETRFFGPLEGNFTVLTHDQRGMGQSGKPDIPYTMADYADDAAALMDHAGWDQALVVGVSFGGMVAQELVLRHPARVRRLVLCCTASGGAGGASFAYHELPPMSRDARAALQVSLSDIRRTDAWKAANPAQYRMLHGYAAADPFADEEGHAAGAARQLAARAGHDTWDRLPQIACPVLVAGGRHDGIARPEVVRALAARIPGARLAFFDGGHLFFLDDPAAWPAIIEFLEG
ncbi:MAG: alpha/beta fold hydrolase [Alphaproteobacteria bacterium]|nr:alpha/beta fold hydrolase [Alphaproteobacteria bacterium]